MIKTAIIVIVSLFFGAIWGFGTCAMLGANRRKRIFKERNTISGPAPFWARSTKRKQITVQEHKT